MRGEGTIFGFGCPRRNDSCSQWPSRMARCAAWEPSPTARIRFCKFIQQAGFTSSSCGPAMRPDPTGFVLYWQLTQLGVQCAVIAPTLVPKKSRGSGSRPIGGMP